MSGRTEPITPATLLLREGVAYSERFGDVYWSVEGGAEETRHIFFRGNGLPERWLDRDLFTILETGFGTGLNFLSAWQLWRDSGARGRLHYLSIEKHPFTAADLARLHAQWPQLGELGRALLAGYPPPLPGFHRLHLDAGRVVLTLLWGDIEGVLPQVDARVDAFFLDGFAPAKNPAMWSETVCRELARLAAPGATLATYTVAGNVRRALAAAGFAIDKHAGFGRKREMLVGHKAGTGGRRPQPEKHAIIIGAGLAGTACAERLAERGWTVDLIERRDAPARETSGNPAGLVQPVPSADWNRLSRISFAGFRYTLQRLERLAADGYGPAWQRCGVLRLARDETHARKQARIVESGLLPEELVRFVATEEATALCGARVVAPGWWFPAGASVHPASLCNALLTSAGERVRPRFLHEALALEHSGDRWRVVGSGGATIAEAPVIVLANGYHARRFAPAAWLPLRSVRGQITCIPARPGRDLRCAVAREGYVTPATSFGVHVVGATYEEGSTDETARPTDHLENLERLQQIVPDFAADLDPQRLAGRAGIRTVGPDRLPLVGALPDPATRQALAGLHGMLGLGSRGLVFAPLAAELLACRLSGEPLPLERDLAAFLDPARVLPAQR